VSVVKRGSENLVPLILSQGLGPDNALKDDLKKMKRIDIAIETHRILIVRGPRDPFLAWCAACAS
jgi:hypothetical protein